MHLPIVEREREFFLFMGSNNRVVCIKQVKQEAAEEWDESMPWPGDIIEGIAVDGEEDDSSFVSANERSELSSKLAEINQAGEYIWLKVRRGENTVKLRVRVVPDRSFKLQKRFTVQAASDERHVAVIADMTFEECYELQEMSRREVNVDLKGFHKKGVKYDWKLKVGLYLPDHRCTVVSSILFVPMAKERGIEAPMVRVMAWFSAAVSSGVPLIFINIQTEKCIGGSEKNLVKGKELAKGSSRKLHNKNILHGIRLWFLPGVSEISLELNLEPGETRFGMDMKRTEEGFICIYMVREGTAADRAGLGRLFDQANVNGKLLVVSRLQKKSLLPSTVDSKGLIHCCDSADIKGEISLAMEKTDSIQLHVMSWSNQTSFSPLISGAAATLRPPSSN